LLIDGCGQLYNFPSARTIEEAVWWIADGLTCAPHAWAVRS
jgi:hypothetical protein